MPVAYSQEFNNHGNRSNGNDESVQDSHVLDVAVSEEDTNDVTEERNLDESIVETSEECVYIIW